MYNTISFRQCERSDYLIAKANYLEFENKELIEVLKTERKKRYRNKKLNLLGKEDDSLQLFLFLRIQVTPNFAHNKEIEKE